MSVWKELAKQRQAKESTRSVVDIPQTSTAAEIAREKAMAEKTQAGIRRLNKTGAIDALNEIQQGIPGSKIDLSADEEGHVKARVSWEVPSFVTKEADGQTTVGGTANFGVEIETGDYEGILKVGNYEVLARDRDWIERQLAEHLGRELDSARRLEPVVSRHLSPEELKGKEQKEEKAHRDALRRRPNLEGTGGGWTSGGGGGGPG